MFMKAVLSSLLLVSRVALATPVDVSAPSFNNYNGDSSMSNFDGFYGQGNFDGSQNSQVVVIKEKQVVCETVKVELIQQKLAILREVAKRIITEQICEVETQTIVLEQFSSSMSSFGKDVSRKSHKQVGYDSNVASLLTNITASDGSLSQSDLGFNGTDVGSNTIVPSGSNWNDTSSPAVVSSALNAAKTAAKVSGKNSTSSSSAAASSTVAVTSSVSSSATATSVAASSTA